MDPKVLGAGGHEAEVETVVAVLAQKMAVTRHLIFFSALQVEIYASGFLCKLMSAQYFTNTYPYDYELS